MGIWLASYSLRDLQALPFYGDPLHAPRVTFDAGTARRAAAGEPSTGGGKDQT